MKPRKNDGIQYLFALFIITCLVLIMLFPGCNQAPPQTEPAPEAAPNVVSSVSPSTVTKLYMSKAPKVDEIVDITFNLEIVGPVKNIKRIWIEFERYDPALYYPLGRNFDRYKHAQFLAEKFDPSKPYDVYRRDAAAERPETLVPQENLLVEGDLDWEGDYQELAGKLMLNSKVRFPEEGEWVIYARFQSEGEIPHYFSEQRLTITKESGTFGWPEAYSYPPGGGWQPPTEDAPIAVTLKPGRAPLLGEPLDLTVAIQANRDVPEGEVYLNFFRHDVGGRKSPNLRIDGDLSWSGSLKKDVPVQLSGKVSFYEEGDFGIEAWSKTTKGVSAANKHSIFLHVGREASRFGWTGSKDLSSPTSPLLEGEPRV
jgi:hypothetical protein